MARRYYLPFGEERGSGTGTLPTTYTFTGQRADATGLMYYIARYYDPYLNQFIQPDTIVPNWSDPQTLNRYTYANNDPVNRIDPSGHVSIHIQVVIRYAFRYGFVPEYVIPSTIPAGPPRWPGQRRGQRVDLADFKNFAIYEVEPYNSNGVYPAGHGPSQVQTYLNILNSAHGGIGTAFVNQWQPGGPVGDERFSMYSGLVDVRAWWDQPGLIVFEAKWNRQRVRQLVTDFCKAAFLVWLAQQAKDKAPGKPPIPSPGYASAADQLKAFLDSLAEPDPWAMPGPMPDPLIAPLELE